MAFAKTTKLIPFPSQLHENRCNEPAVNLEAGAGLAGFGLSLNLASFRAATSRKWL